jgi:beta-N-acetylhexosaminidase
MTYGPIIVSIHGLHLSDEELNVLQNPYVGGVILFSQNQKTLEQLKELTLEIKIAGQQANKDLMIMVDHEGGYVQRFKTGFTAAPSEKVLGKIYDIDPKTALEYAYQLGETVGSELSQAGIQVILGPVIDLDKGNAVISKLDRAYHEDPNIVTELATSYIQGIQTNSLQITLKHFPGHGADIGDSHIMEPFDNRTLEEIKALDLLPFQNLIDHNLAGAIMPAHIKYPKIDPDHTAGNSDIWLKDILREDLHFEGVVISDCLSMAGAGENSNVDKILAALEHGDLALLSHQTPKSYLEIFHTLKEQHYTWNEQSQHRVENWLTPVSIDIDTAFA